MKKLRNLSPSELWYYHCENITPTHLGFIVHLEMTPTSDKIHKALLEMQCKIQILNAQVLEIDGSLAFCDPELIPEYEYREITSDSFNLQELYRWAEDMGSLPLTEGKALFRVWRIGQALLFSAPHFIVDGRGMHFLQQRFLRALAGEEIATELLQDAVESKLRRSDFLFCIWDQIINALKGKTIVHSHSTDFIEGPRRTIYVTTELDLQQSQSLDSQKPLFQTLAKNFRQTLAEKENLKAPSKLVVGLPVDLRAENESCILAFVSSLALRESDKIKQAFRRRLPQRTLAFLKWMKFLGLLHRRAILRQTCYLGPGHLTLTDLGDLEVPEGVHYSGYFANLHLSGCLLVGSWRSRRTGRITLVTACIEGWKPRTWLEEFHQNFLEGLFS